MRSHAMRHCLNPFGDRLSVRHPGTFTVMHKRMSRGYLVFQSSLVQNSEGSLPFRRGKTRPSSLSESAARRLIGVSGAPTQAGSSPHAAAAGCGSPLAFGFVLPQGSDKTPLVLSRGRMESYVPMKVLVNRRHVFFCLPLLLLSTYIGQHSASPVYGGGGGSMWSKVPTVVFVSPETDPRLQVAREAVDFWN